MTHNNALIEKVQTLEDKTRKRGIIVTDNDISIFYTKSFWPPMEWMIVVVKAMKSF